MARSSTTFQIGHIGYNKGKTGLPSPSEEARKKMSLAKLGKPSKRIMTEELKEKLRIGNIGKKRSEETKQKLRMPRRKGWKIKSIKVPWNKGKKLSKEHREKLSKAHKDLNERGDKSPNWRGGKTETNKLLRGRIEIKEWRKQVFERDNFTCQKYGTIGGKIQAHHIYNWADYPELRYDLSNGITLSKKAHNEFHSKYGIRRNTLAQLKDFLGWEEMKIAI